MNLHYRIVEEHPLQHSIVVRFTTDVLNEAVLCNQFEEDGSPHLNVRGEIGRCRFDYNIDLPLPEPADFSLPAFLDAKARQVAPLLQRQEETIQNGPVLTGALLGTSGSLAL